jgi:hypothetical protein
LRGRATILGVARRRRIELDKYRGPATLISESGERDAVQVDLALMQEQVEAVTFESSEWLAGLLSWGGTVTAGFMPGAYTLELPDGRTGEVLLPNNSGGISGNGSPPFGDL